MFPFQGSQSVPKTPATPAGRRPDGLLKLAIRSAIRIDSQNRLDDRRQAPSGNRVAPSTICLRSPGNPQRGAIDQHDVFLDRSPMSGWISFSGYFGMIDRVHSSERPGHAGFRDSSETGRRCNILPDNTLWVDVAAVVHCAIPGGSAVSHDADGCMHLVPPRGPAEPDSLSYRFSAVSGLCRVLPAPDRRDSVPALLLSISKLRAPDVRWWGRHTNREPPWSHLF